MVDGGNRGVEISNFQKTVRQRLIIMNNVVIVGVRGKELMRSSAKGIGLWKAHCRDANPFDEVVEIYQLFECGHGVFFSGKCR